MATQLALHADISNGAIIASGPAVQQLAEDAPIFCTDRLAAVSNASSCNLTHYHITVLSRAETERLPTESRKSIIDQLANTPAPLPIQLCSITGNTDDDHEPYRVGFLCLYWPAASLIRARLGLPQSHFYITMYSEPSNLQNIPKCPTLVSLRAPIMNILDALQSHMKRAAEDQLDHLASPISKQSTRRVVRQTAQEALSLTKLFRISLTKITDAAPRESEHTFHDSNHIRKKVALLRVVALRAIDAPLEELHEESSFLARTAPHSPTIHLQLALTQFKMKLYTDSMRSAWNALLVIEGLDTSMRQRAITVLAKCQEHLNCVRLDVQLLDKPKNELKHAARGLKADQDATHAWQSMNAEQKATHDTLLGDIALEFERGRRRLRGPPIDPRQSRFSLLHNSNSVYDNSALLPWYFSWVVPFRLAGSKEPMSVSDIDHVAVMGINKVVSLTLERQLPAHWFNKSVRNVYIPVRDYHTPSFAQMDVYFAEVTAPGAVALVHCRAGKGRTGVFLAAWFMLFGVRDARRLCPSCAGALREGHRARLRVGSCVHDESCSLAPRDPAMNATDAVQVLCALRPISVDTQRQHDFLNGYYAELWRRSVGVAEDIADELDEDDGGVPLEVLGRKPTSLPQLLVLMGLPGSGKSHLATRIAKTLGDAASIASQDELKTRSACEAVVTAGGRKWNSKTHCVVVDRCNLLRTDRVHWFDVAFRPCYAVVIDLATDVDTCKRRAAARVDHPTLAPDRAVRVIDGVRRSIQRAAEIELDAGFSCVLTVRGTAAADEVIAMLESLAPRQSKRASKKEEVSVAVPNSGVVRRLPGLFKFPRTRHLIDLGSCSRDDLRMSRVEATQLLRLGRMDGRELTVEEKVDGANLGFSVTADGEIRVQNRSHYVNSSSHVQFRLISRFVIRYETYIREVCKGGRVLFGEWMYAKHSVRYTRLPSNFIAFDVYDPGAAKFLSRRAFDALLDGTTLQRVHRLDLGDSWGLDELERQVRERQSQYTDGVMEGVYVRIDHGDWLEERSKVVREGFICGNEHWSARNIEINGVTFIDELWDT